MSDDDLLGYAACCRVWIVHPLLPLGRCGLCQTVPIRCHIDKDGYATYLG